MAQFARSLLYGGCDGDGQGSFTALIELSRKKGGSQSEFVLFYRILNYKHPSQNVNKILRLEAKTVKEAKQFWPWGTGEIGVENKFPGFEDSRWESTVPWLSRVALSACGMWVRVGSQTRCGKRRKKKLKFGDLGHLLMMAKAQLKWLENSDVFWELEDRRSQLLECDFENGDTFIPPENAAAYEELSEKIKPFLQEITAISNNITALNAEMQYVVRKKFPESLHKTPKRELRKVSSW